MGRKYDEKETLKLFTEACGRCQLCNNDIMDDWFSHSKIEYAEKAHIYAFSDNGPRADLSLTSEERNKAENLMLLCPTCHAIIDKKKAESIYNDAWLVKRKNNKARLIKDIMSKLNDTDCIIVKYISPVGSFYPEIKDEDLYLSCFTNYLFSKEDKIINLNDNRNKENISLSLRLLDESFDDRIKRYAENNMHKTFCLFAVAPQPLLIYLGKKFGDKLKLEVFTMHRGQKWILNDKKASINFRVEQPEKCNTENQVVLLLNATASIDNLRVVKAIGDNVDIWSINSSIFGIDIIQNTEELNDFHKLCVKVMDEIGVVYGKNKEINVFSAVCNSLAITFGRSIFEKSHNKINIYDTKKDEDNVPVDKLALSI